MTTTTGDSHSTETQPDRNQPVNTESHEVHSQPPQSELDHNTSLQDGHKQHNHPGNLIK